MKKQVKRKIKSTIRKTNKKVITPIFLFVNKHCRCFVYTSIFILGLACLTSIFFFNGNWGNIGCGIGTGILTSLLVTIIINAENDAREKRKLDQEKRFIFNDIIVSSLDVYGDVIYRINEYLTLSEIDFNGIYRLYSDFKPFNKFAEYLKSLNLEALTEPEKSRLDKLFNFGNYRIDYLVSNLKHLPKQDYFLRGLLSEDEYHSIASQTANDSYISYVEHINEFWNDEVIDIKKCIQFLRMTLFITSKTIATFDYATKKASDIETGIKTNIDQLYYDEIYSKSEEFALSLMEKDRAEAEYYSTHPEEAEELERWYNRTDEDWLIDDLYNCLFGFSQHRLVEILDKLDPQSDKVKAFFGQQEIRDALKKKRKIKRVIKNKYGKVYLDDIEKTALNARK